MTALFLTILLAMGWGTESPVTTAAVGWGTEAPSGHR
jgi:hypothetical protein